MVRKGSPVRVRQRALSGNSPWAGGSQWLPPTLTLDEAL
jgi:hypothetical protein